MLAGTDVLVENSPILDSDPEAVDEEILLDPALLDDLCTESTDDIIARRFRSRDDNSRHD